MKTPVLKGIWALVCLIFVALPAGAGAASPDFANWAAVVVAGDFHAHDGGPTEAFDNARRDVTRSLIGAGFSPGNIQQFSVRPERYPGEKVLPSQPSVIAGSLEHLAMQAKDGCLLYFSSHGAPEGILLNDKLFSPAGLSRMVDDICGQRPTVVILSACFSGVFIPSLKDANRVILTAARPDRTSFGCTQNDKYPYYDDCIISSFPKAPNFSALATAARTCVSAREIKEGASPPSEPQLSVGPGIGPYLPFYTFAKQ
jgi:hypothetical protein